MSKGNKPLTIPASQVDLVIDKFYALLNQAISEGLAGKRFPPLKEIKFNAGIEVTNTAANPWLPGLSEAYQQARLQVHGPGAWQNQFRAKRQRNAGAEIESLIGQILAQHGAMDSYRLSYYVMRGRGLNRRDEALVIRTLKRMTLAGQLRNVGAGRYTLARKNTHERS